MELKKYEDEFRTDLVIMIKNFFNEHRDMTKSREEFYISEKEAEESLDYWNKNSDIYMINIDNQIIGFTRIRFGGTKSSWLEDLFIIKEYRGNGYGNQSMKMIDAMMKEKGILAMFVDVIPRNPAAIKLYLKNGFDHLNMIQLRKNYDNSLNKSEKVDVLGFEFIKY